MKRLTPNQGRYRATEFLQVNWRNAKETVPDQHSDSVKIVLLNGKKMQCVTHFIRERGIIRNTPVEAGSLTKDSI